MDLLIACCNCPEPVLGQYTNCSLEIQNLDNAGAELNASSNNEIPKKAFGIRLKINLKEDICMRTVSTLFIPSVNAFSCDCFPGIISSPIDSITSIQIYTVNEFDPTHPAEADVSDYFHVFEFNEFYGLPEYIDRYTNILFDYYIDDFIVPLQWDLLLMSPPSLGIEHQFKVQVNLSDGRILSMLTNKVNLI